VVDPAADRKLEMMTSSSEMMKASSAPETMPGSSSGSRTLRSSRQLEAPRSAAASA
jgi:hypothetical protein